MVDEIEFMHMDLDENRSEKFECDECESQSSVDWVQELEDEHYEALQAEGWIYDEGNMLCDECKDRLKNY